MDLFLRKDATPEMEFIKQVGISQERGEEIAGHLDFLMKKYKEKGEPVLTGTVFKDIAAFCNTNEELVFACISHTSWLAIRGHILCKPKSLAKHG